jgi:metal-responsive CopG/Arc/MetJ family transcriptional regulator
MKHRISVTLNEDVVLKLKEAVRNSPGYHNQSHFVEMAIIKKLGGK